MTRTQTAGVVAVAFAAGVAIGLYGADVMTSGDEAPIRVRGGSMYFDILDLTSTAKWKKKNQDVEWGISKGKRANKTLRVHIFPVDAGSCPGAPNGTATVDRLIVEYDDKFTVEIYSDDDKHLSLKADDIAKLQPQTDQTLGYGAPNKGYIEFLYANSKVGVPMCTFTQEKKLIGLTVNDY